MSESHNYCLVFHVFYQAIYISVSSLLIQIHITSLWLMLIKNVW